MIRCNSCGHQNETGNAFCLNCGAALERSPAPASAVAVNSESTAIARVERSVYFSVARVVAWVLAIVALLAMIYSAVGLVPAVLQVRASADSVDSSELAAAVDTAKAGGQRARQGQGADAEYSAKDLAALDQAIYELVQLVPAELIERQGGMDAMRSYVKREISGLDLEDLDDEVEAIKDARDVVEDIAAPDRLYAINTYFDMTRERIQSAQSKALAGKAKLTAWMTGFGVSAITLMLVTMILVLMTIERNTRR